MLHQLLLDFERVPDPDGYVVRALLTLGGEPPAPAAGARRRRPLPALPRAGRRRGGVGDGR